MNVYFLVEGRRTERKIYPRWLSYAAPHLQQVSSPVDATDNSYFLISGEGYPAILGNHLFHAICDIEKTQKFDLLVVVLDAEELSAEERSKEVFSAANSFDTKLTTARLEVVVQNRCLETWLLGNRRVYIRQPQDPNLRQYTVHYDVEQHDPELMPLLTGFNSHGQFHLEYLKSIFRERSISYTKLNPGHAGDRTYFDQLSKRTKDSPDHLKTFSDFLKLCESF